MNRERISAWWTALRERTLPHAAMLRRQAASMRAELEGRLTADPAPVAVTGTGTQRNTQTSIRRHVIAVAAIAVFLFLSIGVLGAITQMSGAVIAMGSLVVESSVKRVQHPTGGVVGEVVVRDGSRVKAGDLLLRLDPTEAQANFSAVTKALWELTARTARLEAERDGADAIVIPPELQRETETRPDIARIATGEQ